MSHSIHVTSVSSEISYFADPLARFSQFCQTDKAALLLESAEIDSKDNLKSIMLLSACLRFVCHGQTVTATALNDNGKVVLNYLRQTLVQFVCHDDDDECHFSFPLPATNIDEDERLQATSVFTLLRSTLDGINCPKNSAFSVFLGGCFAYDLFACYERLQAVADSDNSCPDYIFYLAESLCLLDHQHHSAELISNQFSETANAPLAAELSAQQALLVDKLSTNHPLAPAQVLPDNKVSVNVSDEAFCQQVEDLKEHILAGDIFQVVPSRTFSLACPSPLQAYSVLKQQNPSPYMFYLHTPDFAMFGASPESALKYTRASNQVEVYPIAGTRPRGKHADGSINHDLDSRFELDLRNDEKEKSEHTMLVDLARNDVAKVSQPGTRYVKDLLNVDRYSQVMHLVSRVVGQLREDLDALHAYQACMNMGTLVGAPKVSAAQLIRSVEQIRRGSYGGAVGYMNGVGDMDTCIVIRSAFVANGIAHVQAGAGVVYDSIPQAEADETRAKAQAVIRAIATAHKGEELCNE